MRAIFINAVDRKVEEIQIENKLEAFYDKIGCKMIQVLPIGGDFLLIVDEEGRLRDWKVGFQLGAGEGIAGNGIVVREKSDGDFTDCPKLYGLVIGALTQFLDLEKNPLPPPAFGVAVLTDLKPESIDKARAEAMKDMERQRQH